VRERLGLVAGRLQQCGDRERDAPADLGHLIAEGSGGGGHLGREDGPASAVLVDEREERARPGAQAFPRRRLDGRGEQTLDEPLAGAPQHRGVEAVLGAEVGVEHRLGHADRARDVVHGRRVVAAAREHVVGDLEHLALALLARHALAGGGPHVRDPT
jgi:hypothetical protein